MASEQEKVYAVVLFLPRRDSNNLIDLIPCSWIFTDERGIVCRYLDSEDYDKLRIACFMQSKNQRKNEFSHQSNIICK